MNPLTTPRVLVLLDGPGGTVEDGSFDLLAIARHLGEVHAGRVGVLAPEVADRVGQAGVAVVHHVRTVPHSHEDVARAVTAMADAIGADLVLMAAGAESAEIAALTARGLDASLILGAAALARDANGGIVADTEAFAGTWIARVRAVRARVVATVRPACDAPCVDAEPVPVLVHALDITTLSSGSVQVLERRPVPASDRPDLARASVVVVGGRGTEGDFGPLEELAHVLGGAVGATRVATDEGWITQDTQIGQTGVSVSPQLYIGAGVSGAVHHRGGMQSSRTVVAINVDPEAPIFDFADVGVVGDLFRIVPELTAELRNRLG